MDERLLSAPSLAITASYREIELLLNQSVKTLSMALDGFFSKDNSISSKVLKCNEDMHEQEKNVTDYIVKISIQNLTMTESNKISALYANLSDIARVGEIAENITKYTKKSIEQDLTFSLSVQEEIRNMTEYILQLSNLTSDIILNGASSLDYFSQIIEYIYTITNNYVYLTDEDDLELDRYKRRMLKMYNWYKPINQFIHDLDLFLNKTQIMYNFKQNDKVTPIYGEKPQIIIANKIFINLLLHSFYFQFCAINF